MKRSVKCCYLKPTCSANESANRVVLFLRASSRRKTFPFQFGSRQIAKSLIEEPVATDVFTDDLRGGFASSRPKSW